VAVRQTAQLERWHASVLVTGRGIGLASPAVADPHRPLRHYNAAELLASGLDLRTVAGRLGHGRGRSHHAPRYAAWADEAG
jgi:site-specific recombinase XerC